MRHWRCKVCGHILTGDSIPEVCPHCNAPRHMFHTINEEEEHAHVNTNEKIIHSDKIKINPFFGNFHYLSPYIYTIPVGEKLNISNHLQEEMLYVIKGSITFSIGKHVFHAKEGDALQAKQKVAHSIENAGSEAAEILVIKSPK